MQQLTTHFLWRTNLSTQISFKAGVSLYITPRMRFIEKEARWNYCACTRLDRLPCRKGTRWYYRACTRLDWPLFWEGTRWCHHAYTRLDRLQCQVEITTCAATEPGY